MRNMKIPLTLRLFESMILKQCRTTYRRFTANPSHVGVGVLKTLDKNSTDEEKKNRFPAFERLNVVTESRVHNLTVPCDQVIKFIKLGAINKNIAVQYCHYIANLARSSQNEDKFYYSKRCADLLSFIHRHSKDIAWLAMTELIADVFGTSKENCRLISSKYLDDDMISKFNTQLCAEIMSSYYKFQMWDEAQSMIMRGNPLMVSIHTMEPLKSAIIEAGNIYRESDDELGKKELRSKIIRHLLSISEKCREHRVQFVLKDKLGIVRALESLNIKVKLNPTIKMFGRCTSCETIVPLYDVNLTKTINQAINQLILKGSDKDLYLNVAPNDWRRFHSFLDDIFRHDRKPLDCVIDGLNIAYRNSVGHRFITKTFHDEAQKTVKLRDPEKQARILINIIIRGNFLNNFKKILVVGKHHMAKWPGLVDFFEQKNIHFFPSYNNSKDDLLMLYASTINTNTVLVTNDFLRDHLAQLIDHDRISLERWIDTHQAWINYKTLRPIWPTLYEKIPSVDRDSGVFHLPIIDGNMIGDIGITEPPPHVNSKMVTWLCCKSNFDTETNKTQPAC